MLDMLAVMIGCTTAGSRGLFALGRDARLPQVMGRSSSRGIPVVAGAVLMATYAVTIAITIWWTSLWAIPGLPHYIAMFTVLAGYGSLAIAAIYFLLCIGALRGLADHPKYWAVILAAVVGLLVTGAAIFGAVYQQPAPLKYLPYVVLAFFVVGLVVRGSVSASPNEPVDPGTRVKL
jgi:amino acid transporter